MKKAYASHELAYRNMAVQGIQSWDKFSGSHDGESDIDPPTLRFLNDVLSNPWAPRGGQCDRARLRYRIHAPLARGAGLQRNGRRRE
jgi:hypothetical protein